MSEQGSVTQSMTAQTTSFAAHGHAALPQRAQAARSIDSAYRNPDAATRSRAIEEHFDRFPLPGAAVACHLPG